jgi:Ca2+-binding RTX toxin-like protein
VERLEERMVLTFSPTMNAIPTPPAIANDVTLTQTINLSGITDGDGGRLLAGQITVDSITPTLITNDTLLSNVNVVFAGNQTTALLQYDIDALGLSGTNVVTLRLSDGVDPDSLFSVTINVYDPLVLISNWRGGAPGEFAQLIDQSNTGAGPVTTWTGQTSPVSADVTKINYTANNVYITAPELADYVMGPWFSQNPFATLPRSQNTIFRFSQGPTAATGNHTATQQQTATGVLVNGVPIYDQQDGFSWNNNPPMPFSPGIYQTTGGGFMMPNGSGIWNRNTAVGDVATLDQANGHPSITATFPNEYHNHFNPVALRAELYDNIYYSGSTAVGQFPFDSGAITKVSNTGPIIITSAGHHLANGRQITITGVTGNTAANGNFTVANVTADTFELLGSNGNGTYTGGGAWTTVEIQPDFDTDDYDEESVAANLHHSPILGWALDGFPIYGPYGYSDPMDASSPVVRLDSSFQLRTMTTRTALPGFVAQARSGDNVTLNAMGEFPLMPTQYGPTVSPAFPLGYFVEDYEYVPGLGDLDQYNSRFTVTPEYPNGTQAYFMTIDAASNPAFPFSTGRQFFGNVTTTRVSSVPTTATLFFDANNTPPTFSYIPDQVIYQNTSSNALKFTVSDGQTPVSQLNVVASSSNPTLVPLSGIVLNGSGKDRTITVTPAAGQTGTTTIKLSAVDGLNAQGSVSFDITVVSGRNPPTLSDLIPGPFLTVEDSGTHAIALRGITDADGDTQPLKVTATTSDPNLIQDLLVAYTTNLPTGTAYFKTAPNASGTATISVTVEDGGFDRNLATTGDNKRVTKMISVQVGPSADAPTLNTPASPTITESTMATQRFVTFGNLTDGDENTQSLRISATSSNQTLIPDASLLFNFGGADLAATPFVTLNQPAPSAGILKYTPAAQRSGVATITLTVTDSGADLAFGTTDDLTISRFFTVTVAPVNDPPQVANAVSLDGGDPVAGPLNVNANLTTPLVSHTIDLTGISAGPFEDSQQLQVTVVSDNTTLIPSPSVSYTQGASTATINFTPAQNRSGVAKLKVYITDEGADGDILKTFDNLGLVGGFKEIEVRVAPFNNPPTLDPVALPTGTLATAVSGTATATTITLLDVSKFVTPASVANPFTIQIGSERMKVTNVNTATKTLTVERGAFGTSRVMHPTTEAVNQIVMEDSNETRIALSGITAGALGVNGGTETQILNVTAAVISSSIPGLIGNLAVDYQSQNPSGTLRFTPASNMFGTATIRVTVEDAGINGTLVDAGPTDNATFPRDITITVNNIADLPTLDQPANVVYVEGVSGNLIPLAGISDGDLNTQTLTITATNNTPTLFNSPNIPVLFTQSLINPSAALQNATLDLTSVLQASTSGSAVITVRVTDAYGTTTKTFNLQVASIASNDPPTLDPIANVSRPENTAQIPISLSGISAGPNESQNLTITVTSDQPTKIPSLGMIAYTQGSSTASFNLAPVASAFGDVNITVRVTDDNSIGGNPATFFERTFKVTLTPVNDAPTLNASTASIAENSPNNTAVATLDFQDIDTPTNQLSFSIVSGNTNNAFSIDANGVLRVANENALDFEVTPTFSLMVKVNDNSPVAPTGLSSPTRLITVNLIDAGESLLIDSGDWNNTAGLTLVRTTISGVSYLHVRNSGNNQDIASIPAQAFANVTDIQVSGRANFSDILTLDYSGGDPVPAGGLVFDGDTGTSDTLRFVNAAFDQLDTVFGKETAVSITGTTALGPDAGPLDLANVEVLKFETTVSTVTALNFEFDESANSVTFAEDGLATNDLSKFTSSGLPTVIFPTSAKLALDVGEGNNTVTFMSIEDPTSGPAITVQGGSGNDRLQGSTGFGRSLELRGGAGNDTLVGGINADTLLGEEGNDTLTGLLGNDVLDGGTGSNTLVETGNVDMILNGTGMTGGLGTDSVSNFQFAILTGGASGNTISAAGFAGKVTIDGAGGDDILTGSGHGDLLTGGLGNDNITGGGGSDTLKESGNVNFLLTDASLTGLGSDTLSNLNFVLLIGGTSNNTLNAGGFSGSATLQGGDGNDVLIGGSGNDSLLGDAGNDTLTGGGGTNTLNGGTEADQVCESGDFNFTATATQILRSDASVSTFTQIESVKLIGGAGDNRLTVTTYIGPTTLQGGSGNDTLTGGNGNDSLDGGIGDDQLTGGLGNDVFIGGANRDTVVELGVNNLSLTLATMTGRGTDVLANGTIEVVSVTGTAGNDTINGGTFGGVMIIKGLAGQDRLTGGAGNDLIDGGDETLLVNGILKGDTISGGSGNDTILGGAGDDCIGGGDGNDAIDGGTGNDSISGDNGDDILIGGFGRDFLKGGNDTGKDKIFTGDFKNNVLNDGEIDTVISGAGADTVNGETGVDALSDPSNNGELNFVFAIDYDSIFAGLL